MSSSSSSWEEVRQRRMKMGVNLIHSSTPVEGAGKPHVISDSSINTNSSTNISKRLLTRPAKGEKKQKLAGAKKEKKPVVAKKKTKPAEKKTESTINRKKRKPTKLVRSDSEWLTTAEQTDDEKENLEQSVRSPTKGLALFEDAASPELVRESQAIHDYYFESPVRQRHQYALSPVRVDLGDGKKTLPVKGLPHLRTVFDSSDEEEELLLRTSDPVRTYPSFAHRQKKKAEINIDKSKRWIVDIKIHTASADMLWDEYVREHPEEMREYIAPPAERQKARFFHSKSKDSNKSDEGKATEKEDWRTKKISIGPDDPKYTYIVRGHCDGIMRKFVRKIIVEDPFEFPGPKDAAVKNLSYSEYKRIAENVKNSKAKEKLQRSKPLESASSTEFQRHHDLRSYATRKLYNVDPYEFSEPKDAEVEICSTGDSDLFRAGPSCSKNERIIKKNVKNAKIKEKEKLQKSKPVESASSTEFQRHHDLRSYATRKLYNVDPYEFPEPKDAEVENCTTGDSDLFRAGPSCSKNERITKKNVKNTNIKEKEKLQKSKPVESASSTEFQRHHDLCSYATRKYSVDPYESPEPKDAELEIICSTEDSDLYRAGPSCSKNERITKKNVKNIKIAEEEKFHRSKPVESALFKEFRRYSDLCSYATRLKAKGQEMLSENVAKNSNEKSLVSAQRTSRKRASEVNKDDSKRANIAVDKPTIRSVRDLDGKRYVKEKDNWRII